jgi:putative endonuclease
VAAIAAGVGVRLRDAAATAVAALRGPHRGRPGEDLACRYLESLGWRIVARNFRCRGGELDVVARDGDVTVFVEVKDRAGAGSHGEGVESVTWSKRRRLVRAARLFASSRGLTETPLRFDVIAIDRAGGDPRIRHDRGAFGEAG